MSTTNVSVNLPGKIKHEPVYWRDVPNETAFMAIWGPYNRERALYIKVDSKSVLYPSDGRLIHYSGCNSDEILREYEVVDLELTVKIK